MTTELHLRNSNNRYIIIDDPKGFLRLECVWFCNREDLGDGIYCTHEGEKIWMATYHTDHMIRENV